MANNRQEGFEGPFLVAFWNLKRVWSVNLAVEGLTQILEKEYGFQMQEDTDKELAVTFFAVCLGKTQFVRKELTLPEFFRSEDAATVSQFVRMELEKKQNK